MNRRDQIQKCLELSCRFVRDLLEIRARAWAASWELTQAGGKGAGRVMLGIGNCLSK